MLEFYKNNKRYILPAILILVYIIFIITTWGKWGHIVADCFREILIPQAMLDGKVLYSDISCIYPPLAYQLNAVIIKIFGNSLNVFYSIGIICSSVILFFLYKITRRFSSEFMAFFVVLTTMFIFTFRIIQLNSVAWFFPYSYSFLYAFTSCMIAIYCYFLFRETENKKYLFLTSFLIGLSVAFKPDFLLLMILPLYTCIKIKSVKDFLIFFLCGITPFLATFGIWFLTGGTPDLFLQYKDFLVNFAKAPSVLQFNKMLLVQSINAYALNVLGSSCLQFVICIAKISVFVGLAISVLSKITNNIAKACITLVLILLGYLFLVPNIAVAQFKMHIHYNLVYISYFVILAALVILAFKSEKKNYTHKEKFYFLVTITAFLMSYRIWAAVFISYIGNFTTVLYWLAFVYLLYELLPEYFEKLNNRTYKIFIISTLLIYSFSFADLYFANAAAMQDRITSSKGVFYGGKFTDAFKQAIDYTNKNIRPDETVVIADEGLIINYFCDRKTNMKYYALIPHLVDTIGEDKIIKDLSDNPPEYIYITNNFYPFAGYFGTNYAQKLADYILYQYDCIETIAGKDGFEIAVLKHKP